MAGALPLLRGAERMPSRGAGLLGLREVDVDHGGLVDAGMPAKFGSLCTSNDCAMRLPSTSILSRRGSARVPGSVTTPPLTRTVFSAVLEV